MAQGKLRNIEFQDVDVQILSIRTLPRIRISWSIKPTRQVLTNLKFFVDRGESPSEMKQVNSVGIPAYGVQEYIDGAVKLIDTEKVYYYQIRAVEFFNGTPVQTFTSGPYTWEGDPDLVAMYVIEEHLFKHEFVSGTPMLIYKKLKEGPRCSECWDKVLKRVTKSNCSTCHGTGFMGGAEGGYYAPIPHWVDFNPDPKQVQIAEFGARQPRQTDIEFTNYPILVPGDMLVELTVNRFWRVSNARTTEKNRVTMLQICRLDEINRSDIEYEIKIPDDVRKEMLDKLDQRNQRAEF